MYDWLLLPSLGSYLHRISITLHQQLLVSIMCDQ